MIYSLTDRTRASAWRNCPRSRWWGWEVELENSSTPGLVRVGESLALSYGKALHLGLEWILRGSPVQEAISKAIASFPGISEEQRYLLEGHLLGWAELRYPALLSEYEFVLIEQELRWEVGEALGVRVVDMLRLDGLLRRRADRSLFYLEFKSAASCDDAWIEGWEINSQFLLNIQAVEEVLGERIMGVVIEGLEKGHRDIDRSKGSATYGQEIQNSPFCYAWSRVDGEGKRVTETRYRAGLSRCSWASLGVSPEGVQRAIGDDRSRLFPSVPALRPSGGQLRAHREQFLWQEARVYRKTELVRAGGSLDQEFPQNPDQCRRFRRHPCPFLDVCFDPQTGRDPLGSGLYESRVPNHPEGELSNGPQTTTGDSGERP